MLSENNSLMFGYLEDICIEFSGIYFQVIVLGLQSNSIVQQFYPNFINQVWVKRNRSATLK